MKRSKETRNDNENIKLISKRKLHLAHGSQNSHYTNRPETPHQMLSVRNQDYLTGKRSSHQIRKYHNNNGMSKRSRASPLFQISSSQQSHRRSPSLGALEGESARVGRMLNDVTTFFQQTTHKYMERWEEEGCVSLSIKKWEKISHWIERIDQIFENFSERSFSFFRDQESKARQALKNLKQMHEEELKSRKRNINTLMIKNLKFEDYSHKIVKDVQNLFHKVKQEFGSDNQELMNKFQDLSEKCKSISQKVTLEEEEEEIDPEFDTFVANALSMAHQRANQKSEESAGKKPLKKYGKNTRPRDQISEHSLNRSHPIGDFEDDLDKGPPMNEEEKKYLDPFQGIGGPVENLSEKNSAEWVDEYNDSNQSEINTIDIQNFFPDKYQIIENCEKSLDRVAVKQIVKMELKRELNHFGPAGKGSEGGDGESPEKSIENEGGKAFERGDQDIIKVYDQDSDERRELSITTPRNELMNSKENQLGVVGEKTVLQHTFEEDSNSSIDSNFFNRDPGLRVGESNATSSENYTASHYFNSNEKNNISNRERYTEGSRINSERSHPENSKREDAFVEVSGQGESKIQFKKINMQSKLLQNHPRQPSDPTPPKPPTAPNALPTSNPSSHPSTQNLLPPKHTRSHPSENPYCRPTQRSPPETLNSNIKNISRDLEVIKENHSEFSNSNSVIETFRNKRKSNISSNNSGDQINLHNPQEMINEEDEEDFENETTSFRGNNKLERYGDIEEKEEDSKQTEVMNEIKGNYLNDPNEEYQFFQSKAQNGENGTCDKELSPGENSFFNRPVNLHAIEMNNKFMRSSSLSPNTRHFRSYSSEIPSYVLSLKDKIGIENEEDQIHYGQDIRVINLSKNSQRKNTDISSYSKFDKEITNEGSQLMKSPSICSITIDNNEKKKTAEFEGEELNPSESQIQSNKDLRFENKSVDPQNLSKEDIRKPFLKQPGNKHPDNLQSSSIFQKFNLGSRYITSSIMSDSNGTFHNQFNLLPYLSSKHAIPPQTLIYYPGNIFEEGCVRNDGSINWNEQYGDFRNRDREYVGPKTFLKLKGEFSGKYNHTFISGLYNGEVASFIRNEISINEKNNLFHTPNAGVLFCSSQGSAKVHTGEDWQARLNPTSKIGRFNNLQSSKGSEATTAKAATKCFISQKLKSSK